MNEFNKITLFILLFFFKSMEFQKEIFFFKCPECKLQIPIIGYKIEKTNNINNIKLIYKCIYCSSKKKKEEKKINLEIEKKEI